MEDWKEHNQFTEKLAALKEEFDRLWTGSENSSKMEAVEQERREVMAKLEIVKDYENAIYQQYDDRWTTTLRDPSTGKRKKIRKQSREEVLEEIVKILGATEAEKKEEPEVHTIATLYPLWRAELCATGRSKAAARYDADWKKYLAETPLVAVPIEQLKTSVLKQELAKIITANGLITRQYNALKIVLNSVLDYAVENDLIPINRARGLHGLSRNLCIRETKEEPQVFGDDEAQKLVAACLELNSKAGNRHTSPLY